MPALQLPAGRSALGLRELPAAAQPVLDRIADNARAVDREAADLWPDLCELGGLGLLSAELPLQLEVVHALARRCTASAFSVWGHRSALEFHAATGTPPPEGAAEGASPLASGMAPAYKEEAGLGEVPLLAADTGDGALTVSGTLPWCSNLRPGARIITPVRFEDGRRAIIRLGRDDAGVSVKPLTGLTALDATSSGVLIIQGAAVAAADVLTDDVPAFRDRVRATFLSLQSAMCLGLAGAGADAAEATADEVARRTLAEEFTAVQDSWQALRQELGRTAEDPGAAPAAELVRIRLETALLAGRATALEQKVTGGRGFALASPTSRRVREAAFLPVQSPTETHLRHVLERAGAPVAV